MTQDNQALIAVAAQHHGIHERAMQDYLLDGDITNIPNDHRTELIVALCRHIGVDPIERPFLIFSDGKKDVLYAARSCAAALCRTRGITREIISSDIREIGGHEMCIVRARATMPDGRFDEATGVVPLKQIVWGKAKGQRSWEYPEPDKMANVPMKAETKAKRRAVLDLVGLGILDESEMETIRAQRAEQVHGPKRGLSEIVARPVNQITAGPGPDDTPAFDDDPMEQETVVVQG